MYIYIHIYIYTYVYIYICIYIYIYNIYTHRYIHDIVLYYIIIFRDINSSTPRHFQEVAVAIWPATSPAPSRAWAPGLPWKGWRSSPQPATISRQLRKRQGGDVTSKSWGLWRCDIYTCMFGYIYIYICICICMHIYIDR